MRDASTPTRKLTRKIFHVNSSMILFSYIFLLWQFKILLECFSSNKSDEIKRTIFKKLDATKMFQILLFILSNLFDSNLEVQCCIQGYVWAHQYYVKTWFIHTKTIFVIHLNRQADTDIHKVFNAIILKEMLKLNVWRVDTLTMKIWLNSSCCFGPVFL